jgi:hypothetical protein
VLGPFSRRSETLAAERAWLEEHLLHRPPAPPARRQRLTMRVSVRATEPVPPRADPV